MSSAFGWHSFGTRLALGYRHGLTKEGSDLPPAFRSAAKRERRTVSGFALNLILRDTATQNIEEIPPERA